MIRICSLLLFIGVALLCRAQRSLREMSVCQVVDQRLGLTGRVLVYGTDSGDGVLRGECTGPTKIRGYTYPKAIWVSDATQREQTEFVENCTTCITFYKYIELTSKDRMAKKNQTFNVRMVGRVRAIEDRKGSSKLGPLPGFGYLGLFPVEFIAIGVEKWERIPEK